MTDQTMEFADNIDAAADHIAGLLTAEEQSAQVRDEKGRFASTAQDEQNAVEADDASGEQNSPDEGEAAAGDPPSGDEAEPTTEQVAEPAIALPPGWSADKADAFRKLPPDVREYITARESERNRHFDRTAQETAEKRKATEAELQATSAARQRYADGLKAVMQVIEQSMPKAPDAQLAATDPGKYIAEKAAYDDAMSRLSAHRDEFARVQQEEQDRQAQAYQEHLSAQAQILDEKIPEWRDEKVRTRDQQDIAKFLASTGYSQDEIAAVADARAVQIARKAMMYDRLKAAKPAEKIVQPAAPTPPATLRPGAAPTAKRPDAKLAALKQRAQSSDKIDDRAAYVLAALNVR